MIAQPNLDATSATPAAGTDAKAALAARRAGTDGGAPLDLRGSSLLREDFSGMDLTGADLSGADLSRADLSRANLFGARLVGAVLFECDLSSAELTSADLTGVNLVGANLSNAGLGMACLVGANLHRAELTHATLSGADLTDCQLQLTNLERARVREATLTGADFTGGRLAETELDHSKVAGAVFDGVDLRGASLTGVEGFRRASWLGVDLREIDFTGAYLCRSFILDQNFIHEFRTQSRWTEIIYQVWRATSDCGRSSSRWAFCTSVLVLVFAWLYTFVGVDYGEHETVISPLYYSVVTMTTLGYGDVLPSSIGGQIVAMVQVIIGYVMLGGLLTILSNKMASRAN